MAMLDKTVVQIPQPPCMDYQKVRMIGRHNNEKIFEVSSSDGRFSLKETKLASGWRRASVNTEKLQEIERDVQAMRTLHYARSFVNCLQAYWVDAEECQAVVVSDYMPLTLARVQAKQPSISLELAHRWFAQLVAGLAAVHNEGFVHARICPATVLLSEDMRDAKLSCAGMTEECDGDLAFGRMVSTDSGKFADHQSESDESNAAGDVYALGLVMAELLLGLSATRLKDAAAAAREPMSELVRSLLPETGSVLRTQLLELAAEMLAEDAEGRPTAADLIRREPLQAAVEDLAMGSEQYQQRLLRSE